MLAFGGLLPSGDTLLLCFFSYQKALKPQRGADGSLDSLIAASARALAAGDALGVLKRTAAITKGGV